MTEKAPVFVVGLDEFNQHGRSPGCGPDRFPKVHGVSHLSVVVDLALGRKPAPLGRQADTRIQVLVNTGDDLLSSRATACL